MASKKFTPQTRAEHLAVEVAERLGDLEHLRFYLFVAHRYSESYIRQTLSQVLEVPLERIQRSRGALFNWLIRHGHTNGQTPESDARH